MLRRHRQFDFAGSIHFVTTVTSIRGHWFTTESVCNSILELVENYRVKFNLDCLGYVLMPDHLHLLLHQSEEGPLVSRFMQGFKRGSSFGVRPPEFRGKALWRENYDDVPVPGTIAAKTKLDYMHNNPIRAGLVSEREEYRWSSAAYYFGDNGQSPITIVRVL